MRITNNIIQREALGQMQAGLRDIDRAMRRASTGLRIQKASDDPVAANQAMRARSSLRALDQYQRNIGMARSRAAAEEGVLDQVTDILTRAKELGLSQGGSTANAATRQATAAEARQLLDAVVALGNTMHGDEYLFGGQFPADAPFDAAAAADGFLRDPARPPVGALEAEISAGRTLQTNHDGQQVFLDSGVLQALSQLADGLVDADPETAIAGALGSLDDAFDQVQALLGETGARVNQMELTETNLDALDVTLRTVKADLEEVDFETAVTELVNRQTTFQAAMLATSKVMGLTLADYLR